MPRTVTYYDTAEVIAMLEADHEREFSSDGNALLHRAKASFGAKPVTIIYDDGSTWRAKWSDIGKRNDWQLTKGKP